MVGAYIGLKLLAQQFASQRRFSYCGNLVVAEQRRTAIWRSRSGFTSLLTSFDALLKAYNLAEVRESFRRTSVKDVKEWVGTRDLC